MSCGYDTVLRVGGGAEVVVIGGYAGLNEDIVNYLL